MAAGYSISIASDTKSFASGVQKGIIEPLGDAAAILEDIGREGGRDIEQIERAARDSQRETKEVREAFSDLQKEIRDTGRKARTDFANPMNDATSSAGRGLRNFRDEAKQNFAEVASSFDGTAQGIADGIQGTLGGAAIAVGGVAGLAIGTLGAIGGAVVQRITEDAELAEERVKEMYDSFIDSGLNYLTEEQALAALSVITGDPEKIAALQQQAQDLGLPIETVLAAQVQKGEERNVVLARANELLDDSLTKLEDGTYSDGTRLTTLEGIVDEYKKLNGEQDTALQGADLYRAASEVITGQEILTNEEIQKRNRLLADTPQQVAVTLVPDETAIDAALRKPRKLKLNIEGVTRNGQVVI